MVTMKMNGTGKRRGAPPPVPRRPIKATQESGDGKTTQMKEEEALD